MGCKSCGKGRSSAVSRARAAQRAKLKAEKLARAQARLEANAVPGTDEEAPVQPEAPSPEATVETQPESDSSGGVVLSDGVLESETEAEGQEEAEA